MKKASSIATIPKGIMHGGSKLPPVKRLPRPANPRTGPHKARSLKNTLN
jgi:hypothetical protein